MTVMGDKKYPVKRTGGKRTQRKAAGRGGDKWLLRAISAILYLICGILLVIFGAMLIFRTYQHGQNEADGKAIIEEGTAGIIVKSAEASLKDIMDSLKVHDNMDRTSQKAQKKLPSEGEFEGKSSSMASGDSRALTALGAKKKYEDSLRGEPVLKDSAILIGGNVYLSTYVQDAYDREGGIEGVLSPAVRSLSDNSDFFMAGQLFPFSDRGEPAEDKEYVYRVSAERTDILREAGIDCVSLANSHALDYGYEAFSDNISALQQAGIAYTGAGEDMDEASQAVIRDINGMRVAFLGVSRRVPDALWGAGKSRPGVFLAYDANKEELFSKVEELNRSCDLVTVYIYWGGDEGVIPDYMRVLARETADHGADLIVCAGPGGPETGEVENYNNTPIVYDLGSMIYGSGIDDSYLLELRTEETDGTLSLRLYPLKASMGYTYISGDPEHYEFSYR